MMTGKMIEVDKGQKNKMVFHDKVTNCLPKLNKAPPSSVSSKSRSGSSTTSGRKFGCSKQTKQKNVSKSPVIVKKPNCQLMPKLIPNQSSSSYESVLYDDSKFNVLKDKFVTLKGQPKKVMTWVPKSK